MQRILSLFVQIMTHTRGNKEFYLLLLVFSPNDEYEFRVGSVVKAVLQWSKVSICVLAHNEKEPQDL